jgi:antitoxin component of RelBE/YafQ-DinJ toxin-antitoxin module
MTYTTNIRLDDDLAEAVKAYAKTNGGISIADAIRILLAQSLNGKEKP